MPPIVPFPDASTRSWRRAAAAAVLSLGLAACASAGGRASLEEPEVGACLPAAEAAARPGTLSVAATGPVDPLHAPLPTSDAERVLFRHLYATLVGVDCRGRLRPGLAEIWSSTRDGARWTFHLDPAARFADGAPLTARAVAAAWRRTDLTAGAGRASPLADASVSADGEHTLVVSLGVPIPDPGLFAAPRFAVAGTGRASAWPSPSGRLRPGPVAGPSLPGRPVGLRPRAAGADGSRFRLVAAGAEAGPRDLLDAGIDVLLTRDPGAARYAGSLPRYRVRPLPWDRVWALAIPGGSGPGPAGGDGWPAVRDGLAGEAVPADARAADGVVSPAACPAGTGAAGVGRDPPDPPERAGSLPGPGTVVHPAGEPSGRALAARLAALAGGAGRGGEVVARKLGGGASSLRIEGLDPAAFQRSLRDGSAAAYLLALPRRPLAPCLVWRRLVRRAPWLEGDGRLVPLIETRPLLVRARDVAGLRLDWDGTPRLEEAGRR